MVGVIKDEKHQAMLIKHSPHHATMHDGVQEEMLFGFYPVWFCVVTSCVHRLQKKQKSTLQRGWGGGGP